MKSLLPHIRIQVNNHLFLKDPESSEIGRKILFQSILLIEEQGLEQFTFKKLALFLNTTESTVYRYFENKNKLLLYLTNWYWLWIGTIIVFSSANISDPRQRLQKMIQILSKTGWKDIQPSNEFDLDCLRKIVISESCKAFDSKEQNEINKTSQYEGLKELCKRFEFIIKEINPEYPFAKMLASTIIEGVIYQQFLSDNMPGLSHSDQSPPFIQDFFINLSLTVLNQTNPSYDDIRSNS